MLDIVHRQPLQSLCGLTELIIALFIKAAREEEWSGVSCLISGASFKL